MYGPIAINSGACESGSQLYLDECSAGSDDQLCTDDTCEFTDCDCGPSWDKVSYINIEDYENALASDFDDYSLGFGGVADIWSISSSCVTGPYVPVDYSNPPLGFTSPSPLRHTVGGLTSQMNLGSWQYELLFENDFHLRSYLYNGILSGFQIIDQNAVISSYCCPNYKSVLVEPCHSVIDNLIRRELELGRYIVADCQPYCVHSLGAVPKKGGGFRPITDCRRPLGLSINNFMDETHQPFCYNSVDFVASMLEENCFMSTVDISSAYRSVHIHPAHWSYHGISWIIDGGPTFLYDTRLSFGLKCAPFVFTQISNFLVRCLHRRGIRLVVNYLDDYILFGNSFEDCQNAQLVLISLLGSLGFVVAWEKCTSPSRVIRFLGVVFDSIKMELRLPLDKLLLLHHELWFFKGRARATPHQLQRLCGIVAHAAKLVRGGRTFSRRLIDKLKNVVGNKRIRLGSEFQNDIDWWLQFSATFNGISKVVRAGAVGEMWFWTDASLSGYGLYSGEDWQAGYFDSSDCPTCVADLGADPSHSHWVNYELGDGSEERSNINFLELVPVLLALTRFSVTMADCHFVCFTDNSQVKTYINKGVSSNPASMALLRRIFWLTVQMNSYVTARYIPGGDNDCADMLSRLSSNSPNDIICRYHLCCSRAAAD